MRSINPATEQLIHVYPEHAPQQVEQRVASARNAFNGWRGGEMAGRSALLRRVAVLLRERVAGLARVMTQEMGKPITQAEAEIEKCAAACEYFAQHGPAMLADEDHPSDATRSLVCYEPLGVILAIMPWNFPFWQFFRFAAPALMAGNAVLLKHAPNTCGCALAIEQLFTDAPAPAGLVSAVIVPNEAAEALIAHPAISGVTFTGSTRAGRAVGAAAGRAIKKVVLELGGSDPFIALGDVDVAAVAAQAVQARCINSGQSCIAAKRFLVQRSIAGRFEQAMAEAMWSLQVGDPLDRNTRIGPLARLDLLENLHRQVHESIAAGARLVTGGQRISRPGFFYQPTLLADVRPGMAAFDEETFGPLAALTAFDSIDDAVRLANLSPYGLGASIWTRNIPQAQQLARRLDAGVVFVNGMVKSDPRLPFGGIKQSGVGRELATLGIREFTNAKTLWIREP